MKWIPFRTDGDQTPIDARKFKHWVGTQEHWFCYHESLEYINQWCVSDWASGYRVTTFSALDVIHARGSTKDAARWALNRVIERHGETVVLNKLRSAPKR